MQWAYITLTGGMHQTQAERERERERERDCVHVRLYAFPFQAKFDIEHSKIDQHFMSF